jgi:uncharacterized protein (DUF2384 family)
MGIMFDALDPPAARSSADIARNPSTFSAPALRGFFRVAKLWGLSVAEQVAILGIPASTFYRYQANVATARLSRDTIERISYVFGIFKALGVLLPREEAADAWVRRPNAAFGGESALDRMMHGNVADLYVVRRYLDGERGA